MSANHILPVTQPSQSIREPGGNLPNKHVPGAKEYYPLSTPPIGTALPADQFPKNKEIPYLFKPLTIKGLTFKNRIWVSPMCQYSSVNGFTTDWHLVHVGGFATRGAGAICVEGTAIVPEGRITPEDNGIWSDDHIPGLKRIVDFVHSQGTLIGIQFAHAGRKAGVRAPWVQVDITGKNLNPESEVATVEEGGWPDEVVGPSAIRYADDYALPKPLTLEQIDGVEESYALATRRAKAAGFDFIEVHGAHGYLIHNFLSPLSNTRTDDYGGSLENRIRLPLRIARRIRKEWGADKPFFWRISASDHAEGPEKDPATGEWKQWGIEQSTDLVKRLKSEADIDLVDVSSAGNWSAQTFKLGPGYQVHFAEHVKKNVPDVLISTVGLITTAKQAEAIIAEGKADVVTLAREFLRDVDFPLKAAEELGVAVKPANQYQRAWGRLLAQ